MKGFAGSPALGALLNPEHVIQRIVATIDSLPRQKLSPDALPIRSARGAFETGTENGRVEIDPRNYERYEPYAQIADAIDAKALVAWYVRFYPLFQQAYRQQGYPDGYFNDRLVFVIDHLPGGAYLSVPATGSHRFAWQAWSRATRPGITRAYGLKPRSSAFPLEVCEGFEGTGNERERQGVRILLPVEQTRADPLLADQASSDLECFKVFRPRPGMLFERLWRQQTNMG